MSKSTYASRPSLSVVQRPSFAGVGIGGSHIVCKFGGTSVAKHLPTIVNEIVPSLQNVIPILVCSAQSYTVKAEGTTQCLFDTIDAALGVGKFSPDNVSAEDAKGVRDGEAVTDGVGVARQHIVNDASSEPIGGESSSRSSRASSFTTTSSGSESDLSAFDDGYSSQTSLSLRKPDPMHHARKIMDGVLERHLNAARAIVIEDGHILRNLERDLRGDCEQVIRWLTAVNALGEISPRIRDSVISIGEIMSCRTVVAALLARNINAKLLRLDQVCPDDARRLPTQGSPTGQLDQKFYDGLAIAIQDRILALCTGPATGTGRPVLVATGFFGPVPGSLLDQIGRGYSDVCAALCARAIAAQELQIWKEVDGVFTADPRKITTSRVLKEISRDQAKLLTSYGSEVVHPLAIDNATRLNIPIVVKNVSNPSGRGTRVVASPNLARTVSFGGPSSTFAVTLLNDLEMCNVHFDDWELSPGRAIGLVMDAIKDHTGVANMIGVDLVTSSQRDVSFMLSGQNGRAVGSEEGLRRVVDSLGKIGTVNMVSGLSYLQIVFMTPPHSAALVGALALGALAQENIEVKMVSHGPMEHGIGCVVKTTEAAQAGAVVHDALLNMNTL